MRYSVAKGKKGSSIEIRSAIYARAPLRPYGPLLGRVARVEVLHEGRQRLHALQRHGVVDGRAHAAHAAVALELQLRGPRQAAQASSHEALAMVCYDGVPAMGPLLLSLLS